MANFSTLIASIEATIKQNGVQAITGQVLQDELLLMVSAINQLKQDTLEGYAFYGQPLADGGSASVTQNTFFIVTAGTYTINGNIVSVTGKGVYAIVYDSVEDAATTAKLFDLSAYQAIIGVTTYSQILAAFEAGRYIYAMYDYFGEEVILTLSQYYEDSSFHFEGKAKGVTYSIGIDIDEGWDESVKREGVTTFAGNLVDTRSAGTPQGPFSFRQSGGDGVNYMRKILGRTIVWNQSCDNGEAARNRDTSTYGSYTCEIVSGHKYFFSFISNLTSAATGQTWRLFTGSQAHNFGPLTTGRQRVSTILLPSVNATSMSLYANYSSQASENNGSVEDVMIVDLTLLGLGDLTTAQFQALFPLPYYNYNAGELKNNAAASLKTTGFNLYDKETGKAYVIGGVAHHIGGTYTSLTQDGVTITPDASGIFTPARSGEVLVGGEGDDVVINISNASRNGEYEPYWSRVISLRLNNFDAIRNGTTKTFYGLDGVGASQDEIIIDNGFGTRLIKRRARIDLGSIAWSIQDQGGTHERATSSALRGIIMPNTANNVVPPLVTSKLVAISPNASYLHTSEGITVDSTGDIYIYAAAFIGMTGAQVQTALSGIYLDYELLTAEEYELVNPVKAFIEVDSLGTEERLPADSANAVRGLFECASNYSVSTANLVRLLNA